jgi:hypothetical protein
MNKYILLIALIFPILTGCGSRQFVELSDDPNCQTTIEGNFFSDPLYRYNSPAIVFSKKSNLRDLNGKIIKKDENGVWVIKKAAALFSSADTVYCKFSDIRAIVDSARHCIWGELTENEKVSTKFKVTIKNLEQEDNSPFFFECTGNSNFSYCALPGKYEISEIVEENPEYGKDIFYCSIPTPVAKFEVKPDAANYLGDFKFTFKDSANNTSLIIPYGKLHHTDNPVIMAGVMGGAIGGAIAGALLAGYHMIPDSSNIFIFNREYNPNYKTKSINKLVKTELFH